MGNGGARRETLTEENLITWVGREPGRRRVVRREGGRRRERVDALPPRWKKSGRERACSAMAAPPVVEPARPGSNPSLGRPAVSHRGFILSGLSVVCKCVGGLECELLRRRVLDYLDSLTCV